MNNNNLFKCPDCGTDVSTSAKTCPNCGNKKIQKQIASEKWQNMDPKKKKYLIIGVSALVVIWVSISVLASPSKCECNQLMSKYGIRKSDNQFVPESDKSAHMSCVKKYFFVPTNEDGSNPCN